MQSERHGDGNQYAVLVAYCIPGANLNRARGGVLYYVQVV